MTCLDLRIPFDCELLDLLCLDEWRPSDYPIEDFTKKRRFYRNINIGREDEVITLLDEYDTEDSPLICNEKIG